MPPNPLSKAHGFAMRSMSLRDMQISKSEKNIFGPPLPNPGYAPDMYILLTIDHYAKDQIENRAPKMLIS